MKSSVLRSSLFFSYTSYSFLLIKIAWPLVLSRNSNFSRQVIDYYLVSTLEFFRSFCRPTKKLRLIQWHPTETLGVKQTNKQTHKYVNYCSFVGIFSIVALLYDFFCVCDHIQSVPSLSTYPVFFYCSCRTVMPKKPMVMLCEEDQFEF